MSLEDCNSKTYVDKNNLEDLEGLRAPIRDHFLGWQCRLRQHSIRNNNGEPSPGMAPDVAIGNGEMGYESIRVLLVRQNPSEHTPELRQMVRKTRDPKQRFENALKFFAENYYADKKRFSGCMTALFGSGSTAAAKIIEAKSVTLLFDEKKQRYLIPTAVDLLLVDDASWQATYWHNHLFNPILPGDSIVLMFTPDWTCARAKPPVY